MPDLLQLVCDMCCPISDHVHEDFQHRRTRLVKGGEADGKAVIIQHLLVCFVVSLSFPVCLLKGPFDGTLSMQAALVVIVRGDQIVAAHLIGCRHMYLPLFWYICRWRLTPSSRALTMALSSSCCPGLRGTITSGKSG